MHWIFYTAGALSLAVGVFGKSQLIVITVVFILVGAVFHRRRQRSSGARTAHVRTEMMDARIESRPGLHDRYEGIISALTGWKP